MELAPHSLPKLELVLIGELLTRDFLPSLAMLEMQIVVPLFFRYFDAKVDSSMTAEDIR